MSKPKKSKNELLRARLKRADKARSDRRLKFHEAAVVDGQVAEARRSWDAGYRQQAKRRLGTLRETYPKNSRVVETLAYFAQEEGDHVRELALCQNLFELLPEQLDVWMYLASAHLKNMHPATARRIFQQSLERWPDHEFADGARQSIELAEKLVCNASLLGDVPESPELYELSEAHEQILFHLLRNRPANVILEAKRLLERWPRFVPTRNNLAEAYFRTGQLDLALQTASETALIAPDDMFAAATMCRLLVRSGRIDEAAERCAALAKLPIGTMDHLIAATEACSLLGKHVEVLELIERGNEYLYIGDRHLRALLHHLAAVAAANLEQRQRARELWEESRRIDASNQIVAENLANFRKPSHEQHGAWAFELDAWLPLGISDRLIDLADARSRDRTWETRRRGLFSNYPGLPACLAAVLQHSGPVSSRLVFLLAKADVGLPLDEPLYEFAVGQRGSSAFRREVLNWLESTLSH